MERFEDIVQIHTEPFDTDVLEEIYIRPYATDAYMTDPFAILVFHYFKLFDQRYGTHIAESINIEQVIGNSDFVIYGVGMRLIYLGEPCMTAAGIWSRSARNF